MIQFLLTNVFFLAVGTVLYIVVRTLPRLGEETAAPARQSIIERLVMSDIPHRVDVVLNAMLGKSFRKMKVLSLRFDNYLTDKLKKINTHSGASKAKPNFIEELGGPLEGAVEVVDNSGNNSQSLLD